MLSQVAQRLKERDMHLCWNEDVVKHLAEAGYDDQYGARPLRRMIQRTVEDTLSERLIAGAVHLGDQVQMKVENGEIMFENVHKMVEKSPSGEFNE